MSKVDTGHVVEDTPQATKVCSTCKYILGTDSFHADRKRGDGLQGTCKPCRSKYMAKYWVKAPTLRRRYGLAQYGLTPEDYERMLESQGGVCAICGTNPKPERHLCVDHDHETNSVRALLCIGCNAGVGHFREEPDYMIAAAMYIVKHKESVTHE